MNRTIKLISISLLNLCLAITLHAQDAGNFAGTALDISRTYPGGTARMLGLGGAQTALGGDISSASSNPAGLGFFNRSELSFSPTFNFINTNADYLNNTVSESKFNFNFANLGVVLNKTKSGLTDDKWRGGSFGISMNRIADFQNQIEYEGNSFNALDANGNVVLNPSQPNDFIEFAVLSTTVDNAGNLQFNNDLAELAFETYLIDAFPTNNNDFIVDRDIYEVEADGRLPQDENGNDIFNPAFPDPDFPTRQRETISSSGAIYQTSIAYGGNYNDQIYFGASLGIMSVDREVERVYMESPTLTTLERLVLRDNYSIGGVGVNATFGVIARPLTPLLLGLSYTTPTTYSLEQTQETVLEVDYRQATTYRNAFEEHGFNYDPFTYNLTTPSRLKGGVTYFFGKNGFLTGDVERVNYSSATLKSAGNNFSFNPDNENINEFESVLNYRIGGEYRLGVFRIRTGYSYQADPTDNDTIDQSESLVSLGGGIRNQNMYFDLGVVQSLGRNSAISPYPGASLAEVENKNTAAVFSIGFFF